MHLFRKAGEAIGPVLGDLSRAMTERLASAKTSTFLVVCHSLNFLHRQTKKP